MTEIAANMRYLFISILCFFSAFGYAAEDPIFYRHQLLRYSMNPSYFSFDGGSSILSAGRLIPKFQSTDLMFAYNRQTDSSAFSYGLQLAQVNLSEISIYNTYSANIGYFLVYKKDFKVRLGLRTNFSRQFLALSKTTNVAPYDQALLEDVKANHLHTDLGVALSYKKLQFGIGLKNSPLSTKWTNDPHSEKYSTRFNEHLSASTAYSISDNDYFKLNLSHFFITDFDHIFNSYQVSLEILQFLEIGATFNNSFIAPFVNINALENFGVYFQFAPSKTASTMEFGLKYQF